MNNKQQNRAANVAVLATAADLVSRTLQKIAGNDVANSIGGQRATGTVLGNLVASRIVNNIRRQKGKAK